MGKMSKPSIDLSELYKPHPQQVKAHLAKEKTILFGGAIRGGKTVWMVAEGVQLSIDYPHNVGILCRQDMPSFKRTVLVELEKYMEAGIWCDSCREYHRVITQHHQTDHYFKFRNGSVIWYTGLGDDTRGLAGKKGMTLGWFGIDQVEETSEMHFNNLIGRLSLNVPNIKRKSLLTANPMPGWVKERFIVNHPDDFIYIPSLPRDNPYLPEDYEKELRLVYPEELVRAWLEGDWNVMEEGNFVFSYSEITKAVAREVDTGLKMMGVDLAWGGADENVAIIRDGGKVILIERWIYPKEDTMLSVQKIIGLIENYKIEHKYANVDAVSGGNPICSRLRELGYNVTPIIAGETADDAEHYINKRVEMYYQLQKRFRDGTISIPNDRILIAQLASIKYEIASEKKLQLISKEYMRKHGLKSPDRADALAFAFYEAKQRNPQIRWL